VRARIAWAVLLLTTLAAILDTVFTAAHRSLLSEATWADHGWPLAPLAGIGCALMGALIISRYPGQPLGWLLCAASLLSVTLAADAYSMWVLDGAGPGSPYWAHVAAWASPLLGWPAFTALILAFLIAPDGHLPAPRWRWALWVTVAGLGLHTLGSLTVHPGEVVYGQDHGHRSVSGPLLNAGVMLVAAGLVASAVSVALRLRRARDDVRRQLLWIAASAGLLAFGVVVVLVVPAVSGEDGTWLAALPLRLAQLAVPLCVAVAVLRHRLLQIDLIVNRALMLAIVTGLVAAGYVLAVVVIGLAVGVGTGGFWPSLLATALVALAFQPLRRRVVRLADRLAFGAAAVPYEALADFSRRLGDSPDPSELLPAVADAAAQAVRAARVTVLLHVGAGPDRVVVWPPSGADDPLAPDPLAGDPPATGLTVPVLDRGERLGSITVEMPTGRPLRTREHRLLADLADQASLAFRNARLAAELSGQVEQLAGRTHELTESRRRLISAGDAERSRLEHAIARQVILHLAALPGRLRDLSGQGAGVLDAAQLQPLVDTLTTALEELREITRGVFPAQLARSGLATALASLLGRPGSIGRLVVENPAAGRRFDPRIEAAAYFCVAEAMRDLGRPVVVVLDAPGDHLRLVVTGSDQGGLPLGHMRDRVEAAGGSVSLTVARGRAVIEVHASGHQRPALAHASSSRSGPSADLVT
jgi:signal transduction histidine kinase